MRVTVIPDDGFVSVDGVGLDGVSMAGLAHNIHAVQWYGNKGEIEYRLKQSGEKPENEKISNIDFLSAIIERYNSAIVGRQP